MAKREKKQTPMRASRKDEMVMPETNEQGWGQTKGTRTQSFEVVNPDGSRTITRTEIGE